MTEPLELHLSDASLDALRVGDPGSAEADRAHLATCAPCRARSEALAAEAAAFHQRFDAAALATELLATPARPMPEAAVIPLRSRATRWATATAGALTALAACALLFLAPEAPGTRTKGAHTAVELFVLDATDQPRAVAGAVDPHARLAVRVSPEGPRFVRLLWESEPGRFDPLYPAADAEAWSIAAPTWLPHTIELDGATEPEHLRVIACDAPFDDAHARARLGSASDADPIAQRDGCDVHTLEVTKP